MHHIHKSFGAVHALQDVSLNVKTGTIHGLVGGNGAGKSTLMSILSGLYQADSGCIDINHSPVNLSTPFEAIQAGIGMVHQHFALIPTFTVVENIILGAEKKVFLAPEEKEAARTLYEIEERYGLILPLDVPVRKLSVGQQQKVEILKALYRQARILILDEPTAVLTPQETLALFDLLKALVQTGVTIIFISHKLREVIEITNTITVMRQGRIVLTEPTSHISLPNLAEHIAGKSLAPLTAHERRPLHTHPPILTVSSLTLVRDSIPRLNSLNFSIHPGEIVGVAGVSGNGQEELLEVLSGMSRPSSGEICFQGQRLSPEDFKPKKMRLRGVHHVPEDRLHHGVISPFSAFENMMLGYGHIPVYKTGPLINRQAVIAHTQTCMEKYDVHPRNPFLSLGSFSGGNQQKIVLAREVEPLADSPTLKLLLVGQPTRGVDVNGSLFIHEQLIALRNLGIAILLVSTDLDEIMSLSDRILVICGGRIMGERLPKQTDERDLGRLMAGANDEIL
jgi:simple sugar transport system ATP-binding protein